MTSVLLVHGAWQSAGCWNETVAVLASAGVPAVAVKLTGLGYDTQHLSPQVRLSTHIEDLVRAIDSEDGPSVLVGHSYAGMVVTGACARRTERVLGVIYVDAFVPENRQSALDLLPESIAQSFGSIAKEKGDGWRLPAGDFLLDVWGVRDPAQRARVSRDFSDFSIRCFEEKLHLPSSHDRKMPRGYIAGGLHHAYPARTVFERFAATARADGWLLTQVDAGHACEIEKPDEVARAIAGFVDRIRAKT